MDWLKANKKKVQYALALCALVIGCGAFWSGVRTAVDIAQCLCEKVWGEHPDKLGGVDVQAFCAEEKNYRPFLDEVLEAEQRASARVGLSGGNPNP